MKLADAYLIEAIKDGKKLKEYHLVPQTAITRVIAFIMEGDVIEVNIRIVNDIRNET